MSITRCNECRTIMSTPEGRAFIRRLISDTGVFSESLFTGNSRTYFNLGMHRVGMGVYKALKEHCPELLVKADREHKERTERQKEDRTHGRRPS